MARRRADTPRSSPETGYDGLISGIPALLDQSRRASARAVNRVLTATYWEVGRQIVEFEQGGGRRPSTGRP